ncbi:MAG TPA: DUF4214 domain-containing protein [Acidimicrobiales bacterium]|nr:DUF4214 domain-containing protein [Acidimicrobiales bacterium]
MLRTLGVAVFAVTALGLATPAGAMETPAASPEAVEAVAPTVAAAGEAGDGLTEVEVELPLGAPGVPVDDGHGHGTSLRSGTVELPSGPQMVIFEEVPAGTVLAVRSRNDGTWSGWTELVATQDDAPDGPRASHPGIGPVWIGHGSEQVEVAVLEGSTEAVRVVGLHPASTPVASGISGLRNALRAGVAQLTGSSFVRPRSDWATSDMGWKCSGGPTEARTLRAMIVHHTATNTEPYAAADVPNIIRGFWRYHVGTRGWCDVAYNFFVDRFGGVWEGRQGGITKAIVGGHTYGFNSDTTSVSQIGNFQEQVPSNAMTTSTSRLVGWKLGYHGLDPQGSTTVTNRTGSTFKGVPNGGQVPVRVVSGHRDLGTTSCPGQHTYATLPTIRSQARTSAHLVGIYEAFMGFTPDAAAFRHWSSVASSKGLRTAALGLAYSPEYAGVLLDDLYLRVLGREADDDGKAYWLGVLASGTRIEEVGALFYGSEEYVRAAGSLEGYVDLLYENLLDRDPEQSGLDYWVGLLRSRSATPPEVAGGFYASLESRLDRVAVLYDRFLGREPDRAGQAHWADELLRVDDIVLAVELALSDEFYARAIA